MSLILCLFSALSRRVGALQISIILMMMMNIINVGCHLILTARMAMSVSPSPVDLIANSVMSEESQPQQPPQYGWQPIVDDDTPVMQPIGEPVAPQPMEDQEDEEAAEELMGQGQKRAAEQPTLSAETQPAKEQLMGKSESQAAEAQPRPMAESDTNADDKQTGQEESSGAGEKETPSQNSV